MRARNGSFSTSARGTTARPATRARIRRPGKPRAAPPARCFVVSSGLERLGLLRFYDGTAESPAGALRVEKARADQRDPSSVERVRDVLLESVVVDQSLQRCQADVLRPV